MRCEELREWLSADLDGEARAAGRAAVRAHLAGCADCRRARAAAEGLRGELGRAAREWVAEDRDEALLAALRTEGIIGGVVPQPWRLGGHEERRCGHALTLECGSLLPLWVRQLAAVALSPALVAWERLLSRREQAPLTKAGASSRTPKLTRVGYTLLQLGTSLRPAAVVMAASFLLTWGALRWAETGRAAASVPASLAAAARVRPPDAELLDEWMAGTPTLAALERLQRLPSPAPTAPSPMRRGAAMREQRRVG